MVDAPSHPRSARRWPAWGQAALLILIVAVGAALRVYGLLWDSGHWLHPDERQIYFVAAELGWPANLSEALSADSPLNPGFFAYGSLPIYLVRIVAALLALVWPALRDLDNLHLAGRPLSVFFDLGTIYLTYRLARALLSPREAQARPTPDKGGQGRGSQTPLAARCGGLFAAAMVSVGVLHVQLARFYTVDPMLTAFVLLTLNLAVDVARGGGRGRQVALGIAYGLAMATKVTAALLLPVILVAVLAPDPGYRVGEGTENGGDRGARRFLGIDRASLGKLALALGVATAAFVFTQPYALIDWRTCLDHTLRESQIAWGAIDVPYTRQYAGTLPFLYSMWQTALWGVLLPLGAVAWAGLAAAMVRWVRQATWSDTLLLAWAGPYFAVSGLLYARYLRYMMPLLPVLLVLAVVLVAGIRWGRGRLDRDRRSLACARGKPFAFTMGALGTGALLYALIFVRIYGEGHPWIVASKWIYTEVAAGTTLAVEDWDTALPLPLETEGVSRRIEEYEVRTLMLYDEPDDVAKWEELAADLAASDYVILASRRLYGSIPRQPERYPLTTRYYERLMGGELGFELAAEFTRGPVWLNPRLAPLPGAAPGLLVPDESFVVYDHPRVLVYYNAGRMSITELMQRIGAAE